MSGNLFLAYPNRIDAATLTGGSWAAALPLNNLKTSQITQVARTSDDALASTKFSADLGTARSLRAFALVNHNLSQSALWKVKLGTTSGGAELLDTGWVSVWQMAFDTDLLMWESPSWWIGIGSDEYLGHPFAAIQCLTDWYEARYVTIEIDDTTNPAGYVQIGRAMIAGGVMPTVNAAYGLRDSWKDYSSMQRAESGAAWPIARRRARSVEFVLEWLSLIEAATLHEMQRMLGTVGEVLYVFDSTDAEATQRYGFLGRLRELSPIEYPFPRYKKMPFAIDEVM